MMDIFGVKNRCGHGINEWSESFIIRGVCVAMSAIKKTSPDILWEMWSVRECQHFSVLMNKVC